MVLLLLFLPFSMGNLCASLVMNKKLIFFVYSATVSLTEKMLPILYYQYWNLCRFQARTNQIYLYKAFSVYFFRILLTLFSFCYGLRIFISNFVKANINFWVCWITVWGRGKRHTTKHIKNSNKWNFKNDKGKNTHIGNTPALLFQ